MSTKTTTSNQNQYNQASMSAYNTLVPQTASMLQSYMNNPMQVVSPYYNLATQQAVRNANAANTARMGNVTGNMAALGAPNANLAAYKQSELNAASRANTANTSNAFLQGQLGKAQAALGVQQAGLQGALGFQPLQTGATQTKTQGGLGSWLPQLVGAGLGAASMFATGGASGLGMAGLGAASSALPSLPMSTNAYAGSPASNAFMPSLP